MNDEIIVQEQDQTITIVDNQNEVLVDTSESPDVVIEDNLLKITVTEEVAERIVINATDVLISQNQNIDLDFDCTAAEAVNDVVYVVSAGTVAKANNSNISTAKAIGFISGKPTITSCKVRIFGLIDGFTGLEVGKPYFLDSTDGGITTSPTTTPGSVLTRLGIAKSSTDLVINVNNNYIIRS